MLKIILVCNASSVSYNHTCSSLYTSQHILYVVIINNTCSLVSDNDVIDTGLCDHVGWLKRDYSAVRFIANIAKPTPCRKTTSFRTWYAIHGKSFNHDIAPSTIISQSGDCVDVLVNAYNDELKLLVSIHVSVWNNTIVLRPGYLSQIPITKYTQFCLSNHEKYYSNNVNTFGGDIRAIYWITKYPLAIVAPPSYQLEESRRN